MAIKVQNIKLSFAPTNPANIADKRGELEIDATVKTNSSTGNSKLSVIFKGEEVEIYEIRGYSKQTEKFDGKVRPINRPENIIFDILNHTNKLKRRNYANDAEAKNFIATGMYIPNSRSGTQQFSDISQQLFQEGSTSAERSVIAASSAEGEAFAGTQSTDSPQTEIELSATNEPGAEAVASATDVGSADAGGNPFAGQPGSDFGAVPFLFGVNNPLNVADPSIFNSNLDIDDGVSGLFYPDDLTQLGQDYMKIINFRYRPEELKTNISGAPTFKRNFTPPSGSQAIYLPIQNLVDSNTVGWGENELNPFQRQLAVLAYNSIIKDDVGKAFRDSLNSIIGEIEQNKDQLSEATATALAGKAAGVSGLLSRAGGAIINPNLTLLFNNPELRKFTFTIDMHPRSEREATNVRRIIRVLKQTMAVRKEPSKLFLLAPNLYRIGFFKGGEPGKEHGALGRSKVCALIGCSVNYLPSGSYMTFDDERRTMTGYQMTLSFNEIEPVYYSDYEQADLAKDEICY
jgi:hypothetical protein